jgi:mannitol-1-phosphate 5-dehydrogenase
MKKAVHFGAGNIGRGFLGQLYSQSGWETVFVDVDDVVLDALNERGGYQIHIVDRESYIIDVENVRAVRGMDTDAVAAEIEQADLVSTAVGQNVLKAIAPPLAEGITLRAGGGNPLNILLCENMLNAAETVRTYLGEHVPDHASPYLAEKVGLIETVIGRMVPMTPPEKREEDPLYIAVEDFSTLPFDAKTFVGPYPEIKGLQPTVDLASYTERKLFIHNGAHYLLALWGYQKGYEYVWQSAEDDEIVDRTIEAIRPVAKALAIKYGWGADEVFSYLQNIIDRTQNRALGDTVSRVARDPARKLGRKDRLVGAALLALQFGFEPDGLIRGIVSAMRYDHPEDEGAAELQKTMKIESPEAVLSKVCGLSSSEPLFRMIAESVAKT